MKKRNYIVYTVFLCCLFSVFSCNESDECDSIALRTSPVEITFDFIFDSQIDIADVDVLCEINGTQNQDCKNLLGFYEDTYSLRLATNLTNFTIKTPTKEYNLVVSYNFMVKDCFPVTTVESIVINGETLCENCDLQTIYTLN